MAANRKTLTDRFCKNVKPPQQGREDYMDALMPNMGLRVTENGAKSFVLIARYPGSPHPARRALGAYGVIGLDQARQKARDWMTLIRQGIDPAEVEEQQRQAEQRKRLNSFLSLCEDFIRDKLPSEKRGSEVERIIRHDLLPVWGGLPVTGVTESHIRDLVAKKKIDAPQMAGNLLRLSKRLFAWGIDRRAYGLEHNPGERLKPVGLVGKAVERDRVLANGELRAFWHATGQMGIYGLAYRMLLLTGQRRNEVCDAQWSEIDLEEKVWTIPAERMKGGAAHEVPLTDDVLTLLASIPRGKAGDYVFSQSDGRKPIARFSAEKERLDALMAKELGSEPKPFVIHDLRRTMRTGLGAIPAISDKVKELVIAHTQAGVNRTYDRHAYRDEKREALRLWQARLRGLVAGDVSNVVALRG
jgi:integrase